ncbi:MAG: hypothetical protein AB7F64_05335 [Gammaproteobacteria bacterium]
MLAFGNYLDEKITSFHTSNPQITQALTTLKGKFAQNAEISEANISKVKDIIADIETVQRLRQFFPNLQNRAVQIAKLENSLINYLTDTSPDTLTTSDTLPIKAQLEKIRYLDGLYQGFIELKTNSKFKKRAPIFQKFYEHITELYNTLDFELTEKKLELYNTFKKVDQLLLTKISLFQKRRDDNKNGLLLKPFYDRVIASLLRTYDALNIDTDYNKLFQSISSEFNTENIELLALTIGRIQDLAPQHNKNEKRIYDELQKTTSDTIKAGITNYQTTNQFFNNLYETYNHIIKLMQSNLARNLSASSSPAESEDEDETSLNRTTVVTTIIASEDRKVAIDNLKTFLAKINLKINISEVERLLRKFEHFESDVQRLRIQVAQDRLLNKMLNTYVKSGYEVFKTIQLTQLNELNVCFASTDKARETLVSLAQLTTVMHFWIKRYKHDDLENALKRDENRIIKSATPTTEEQIKEVQTSLKSTFLLARHASWKNELLKYYDPSSKQYGFFSRDEVRQKQFDDLVKKLANVEPSIAPDGENFSDKYKIEIKNVVESEIASIMKTARRSTLVDQLNNMVQTFCQISSKQLVELR